MGPNPTPRISDTPINASVEDSAAHAPELPLARLVSEIYESSPEVVRSTLLSQLVAKVYEVAAPHERIRMLEQLMMPLGVLSLVAVANGIFARIRFRSGWPEMQVRFEDAQNVQVSDVVALVNHVQQVSVQAIDGLAQLIAPSPVLAGSAAAAVLLKILLRRARTQRPMDNDLDP